MYSLLKKKKRKHGYNVRRFTSNFIKTIRNLCKGENDMEWVYVLEICRSFILYIFLCPLKSVVDAHTRRSCCLHICLVLYIYMPPAESWFRAKIPAKHARIHRVYPSLILSLSIKLDGWSKIFSFGCILYFVSFWMNSLRCHKNAIIIHSRIVGYMIMREVQKYWGCFLWPAVLRILFPVYYVRGFDLRKTEAKRGFFSPLVWVFNIRVVFISAATRVHEALPTIPKEVINRWKIM